jgi:hypothetical protein
MQYFVNIEKKSYFWWQIELLIYSFKRYQIEDQLVVAIADTDESSNQAVPKNLSKCNYFFHKNYGKELGYSQINKPLSILEARNKNILRRPYVVLEPDMILYEPVQDFSKKNIIGNYANYLELEVIKKEHGSYFDFIHNFHKKWVPFGPIFIVNEDDKKMYNRIVDNCIKIIKENKNFWWSLDMLAWIITFIEFNFDLGFIKPDENRICLESCIESNSRSNFLHYRNPKENFFSKYKYKNLPPSTMVFEPFLDILSINSNFSTNVTMLQEIVSDFLIDYKN